jgi:hypothetical protein
VQVAHRNTVAEAFVHVIKHDKVPLWGHSETRSAIKFLLADTKVLTSAFSSHAIVPAFPPKIFHEIVSVASNCHTKMKQRPAKTKVCRVKSNDMKPGWLRHCCSNCVSQAHLLEREELL